MAGIYSHEQRAEIILQGYFIPAVLMSDCDSFKASLLLCRQVLNTRCLQRYKFDAVAISRMCES